MIEVLGVLDKKSMRKLFVYQDSSSLNKLSIASARGRGKDELKNPSVSSRAGIAVFIASCIRPRLQNSRVFFFSKSVKISVKRGVRVLRAQSARAFASLKTSLPSLALHFQSRSRPFVWLLTHIRIRKNTDWNREILETTLVSCHRAMCIHELVFRALGDPFRLPNWWRSFTYYIQEEYTCILNDTVTFCSSHLYCRGTPSSCCISLQ